MLYNRYQLRFAYGGSKYCISPTLEGLRQDILSETIGMDESGWYVYDYLRKKTISGHDVIKILKLVDTVSMSN